MSRTGGGQGERGGGGGGGGGSVLGPARSTNQCTCPILPRCSDTCDTCLPSSPSRPGAPPVQEWGPPGDHSSGADLSQPP
uniref:Uncharacterized protein n=1 Tax=Knipowitschia caucasica TaxID=637954 RepID=A0AAV2J422_KNICA